MTGLIIHVRLRRISAKRLRNTCFAVVERSCTVPLRLESQGIVWVIKSKTRLNMQTTGFIMANRTVLLFSRFRELQIVFSIKSIANKIRKIFKINFWKAMIDNIKKSFLMNWYLQSNILGFYIFKFVLWEILMIDIFNVIHFDFALIVHLQ